MNRLIDDLCDQQQRYDSNTKKLKFVTTNYRDLIDAVDKSNFFSIALDDGKFVPIESVDKDTKLRHSEMTQYKCNNNLGMLPIQVGSRYQVYHGDVVIEDHMRLEPTRVKNSCKPMDCTFYDRSFQIFDNLESPNPLNSVETQDKGFTSRSGVSTRFREPMRSPSLKNTTFNPMPRQTPKRQLFQYTL